MFSCVKLIKSSRLRIPSKVINTRMYLCSDTSGIISAKETLSSNKIPRPGQHSVLIRENVRVLLMSNAINTLSRRVEDTLRDYKVICHSASVSDTQSMMNEVNMFQPDIVICPFLKSKIPESLYKQHTCLIMHPGIAGDRGASSLDWTIDENKREWGVTVLEASDEMDGGNIWSTENFVVPLGSTKTSLYNGCVADAAVDCIVDALSRFCQGIEPIPLDSNPEIRGYFRRNMKITDRRIDWNLSSQEVAARVRMSDTTPGAIGHLKQLGMEQEYRCFDAHVETGCHSELIRNMINTSEPGHILGQKNHSVLVKTGDNNAVWIGQMKTGPKDQAIKLPSIELLEKNHVLDIPVLNEPCCHDDIRVIHTGPICYVHFDFYNGAMDRHQAVRLEKTLFALDQIPQIKVIALMGGDRFFSTGIHLCVIQNSHDKQLEAFSNINAINDVIRAVVKMKNKATVAILQGNAAAGGAMFALACDVTISYPGVFLTPSYKAINLYGSEYWTYFLPNRVGDKMAQDLVEDTTPISARKAHDIGLLDYVILGGKEEFKQEAPNLVKQLYMDGKFDDIVATKQDKRDRRWLGEIERHRKYELSRMKENFRSKEFLTSMHNFVFKLQ